MTLLAIADLGVALEGRALLAGLSLELGAGERLGLVGESGSGKSLTALALAGLLPAGAVATGSVRFEGRELQGATEAALCQVRGRGIGLVFQEPATALNPLMPVGEQVAETARVHGGHTRQDALALAARALARVGLGAGRALMARYPHELSGGQRQRAAIAAATVLTPRLLVADEPTTALDVTTQAQILALLGELSGEDGMALVLISHDLAVVAGAVDRLAILERGRIVEAGRTARVLASPAHPYTARLVRDFSPVAAPTPRTPAVGAALLEAEAVVRTYPSGPRRFLGHRPVRRVLDGIDLTLHAGERVGLVGESGSGKSTLVRTLLGLEAPASGRVRIAGQPLASLDRATLRGLRRTVQAVFQDPYGSLNPRHRVGRTVAEPLHLLDAAPTRTERERRVTESLEAVGLKATDAVRFPHEFSGGERQRIALARALVIAPSVLILDEAVSALDATLRAQILALLGQLWRERGLAYLFVSHDLGVVRAVTDRTIVLKDGCIVEQGPTPEVLERPRHPYTRELIAATPTLERALAALEPRG